MARALLATSLQHPAPRCDGQHKGHNHRRAYAVHGEAPKLCTRCFLELAEQLQSPVPSGVVAALAFSPSQSLTPSLYPRLPTQRCPWAQQLPSANRPTRFGRKWFRVMQIQIFQNHLTARQAPAVALHGCLPQQRCVGRVASCGVALRLHASMIRHRHSVILPDICMT